MAAKAKKLPSGSWRCRVYSHSEYVWDTEERRWKEKKVYESFTSDSKKDAEMQASIFLATKDTVKRPEDINIREAIQRYIDFKAPVLSPSTVTGYLSLLNHAYGTIEEIGIRKIDSPAIQKWISDYARTHSSKTTANAHGLLISSITMFRPDFRESVQMPARVKPNLYLPTDDDIRRLLDHVNGKELEIAILLAAFGPMRRGEICALESSDIKDGLVEVNKSMVKNPDKNWEIKQPKTYSGYRTIQYPQFVIDKISCIDGRIVKATPDQITNRFKRAIRFSGSPDFRFHDLRHPYVKPTTKKFATFFEVFCWAA